MRLIKIDVVRLELLKAALDGRHDGIDQARFAASQRRLQPAVTGARHLVARMMSWRFPRAFIQRPMICSAAPMYLASGGTGHFAASKSRCPPRRLVHDRKRFFFIRLTAEGHGPGQMSDTTSPCGQVCCSSHASPETDARSGRIAGRPGKALRLLHPAVGDRAPLRDPYPRRYEPG